MENNPPAAGYSGTPLVKKLGIKPGQRLAFIHAPEGYVSALIGSMPHETAIAGDAAAYDLIQFFSTSRQQYVAVLPALKAALARSGALWVSWPRKAAGVPTDLTENIIRDEALAAGLVDVKVCAVDQTWSGLKLVYRRQDRQE